MDSLLSTYASSDDDDEQPPPRPPPPPSSKSTTSLFSSLPKPSSSPPSSRLFSSLPPPKPSSSRQDIIPPNPIPKKVKVQFHPPQLTNNVGFRDDDEDEDEVDAEEREAKKRRQLGNQDTSVKSFLSSIPAPKNSGSAALGGALGGPSGGRRSIIDASVPVSTPAVAPTLIESISEQDVGIAGNDEQYYYNNVYNYDVSSYGNYEGYEQQYYDGNEAASLGEAVQGMSSGLESFMKMGGGGKRRKDQPPVEILEVKQDELMKNRPTEDKSKLTGMAFGPSYQPASSKGKPSKLHKRKHQISSLYFDMRAKEPEFQERRAKGFLTKAETQAKYGW